MEENPYKAPASFDKPPRPARWSWPNRYEWVVVGLIVLIAAAALLLPLFAFA